VTHILVVDDDKSIREVLHDALQAEGYDVVATDDSQALQAVRENPPAVILLDLFMPTLTGEEICKQLRADPATAAIPIVAMSAGANLNAVMGLKIFNDQLPKPFTLHTLSTVVARWGSGDTQMSAPRARLGDALDRYQATHGWNASTLATYLQTTLSQLSLLRQSVLPTSAAQITMVAQAFAIDRAALQHILQADAMSA
jgi:CheY-like chemotaxis protein